MRTVRLLIVVSLISLAATNAAAAGRPQPPADPPRLYTLEKAAPPKLAQPLLPDTAEEFLITVEPASVAANPAAFLVDLPGHGRMEAVRSNFADYGPDWKSWFGTLRNAGDGETTGSIHVGFHGDRITALIALDEGERYRIVGGPQEKQRLVRLDPGLSLWSCGLEGSAETQEEPLRRRKPGVSAAPSVAEKILFCSANVTIDLLVVYPSRGNGTMHGYFDPNGPDENALFTFVQNSVSNANQVFVNAGINARYRLVGIVPLIDQENVFPDEPALPVDGLQTSLNWINDQHAEVRNLRGAFGADVVALYIPWTWTGNPNNLVDRACAVANLPRGDGFFHAGDHVVNEGLNMRAFSAHRDTCGLDDLTLAHEIGHNYGMWHSDNYPSLIQPYARGFNFTDQNGMARASVMGCNCTLGAGCVAGNFAVCNRIPFLSDPDKSFAGTVIGTAANNHNARLGCDQVTAYSNFRAPSANTPPNASFTVSCSGRTCNFNANGTTDNAAIPSNNFWWDFGDGTALTRGGRTIPHTYASAGSYRVHLVVRDAGGQTDVVWSTANPWNPIYEGYVEQIRCSVISGWAWDQAIPNTPINVDIYRNGILVATRSANAFRQDLVNAGKGNGSHGFGYTPDSFWKNGQWHTASVRFGGTSTDLVYLTPTRNMICNVSMFPGLTPAENLSTGGVVYTVGTQFSSTHSGQITQIGFLRALGETGTNTLRLWTDSGTQLASAPTSCTANNWCWATISPVSITAGTRYRVSVTTNTFQSKTGCGIGSGITNGPLTAHQGFWIAGDAFPTNNSCSNFFVDVRFDTP